MLKKQQKYSERERELAAAALRFLRLRFRFEVSLWFLGFVFCPLENISNIFKVVSVECTAGGPG